MSIKDTETQIQKGEGGAGGVHPGEALMLHLFSSTQSEPGEVLCSAQPQLTAFEEIPHLQ